MPKLGKLKHFSIFVKSYKPINQMVESVECFYLGQENNDVWLDMDEEPVRKPLVQGLDAAQKSVLFYRARKSCSVHVPLNEFDAVIRAEFAKAPRKPTSEKLVDHLRQAVQYAEHEYEASHDAMTGLLNIKGFNDEAKQMAIASSKSNESEEGIASESVRTIVMFAMDIDHFKQVNDTFGHAYGDIVLKCLANRLELLAKRIRERKTVEIAVARPSGEEFLILLRGDLSVAAIKDIADEIRISVSSTPIPSDVEWSSFAKDIPEDMQLPRQIDRRQTISVGFATVVPSDSALGNDWILKLRNRADRALYSAKANGRNIVIAFSEILQSHGSLVEHHADMDVISINLGKAVGNRIGQEFLVFHPDFTGSVDLTQSDGRTIKKLGKYPRKTCGCIVVFDVQEEVSFCRVLSKDIQTSFPAGSSLEAIPMGSITHLVSDQFAIADDFGLSHHSDLESELKLAETNNRNVVGMVVGLIDTENLIRDRGNVYINDCLAKLFGIIKEQIGEKGKVSQHSNTQFAVVVAAEDVEVDSVHSTLIDRIKKEFGNTIMVACGAWLHLGDVSDEESVTPKRHSRVFALDYARYALRLAALDQIEFQLFSDEVAYKILRRDYDKGRDAQVIEQYRELSKMGIENGRLENIAGISAYRIGDENLEDLMLQAGHRAIELVPSNVVFRENMIAYYSKSRNYEAIYEQVTLLYEANSNHQPREDVLGLTGMALANELKAGRIASKEKAIELLQKARDSKKSQFGFGYNKTEFESELERLADDVAGE